MTTAEMSNVAKAKKGRPKQPQPERSMRDDIAVKVDRTIVGQLKTIATYRGVSLAELISTALRKPTAAMWADMVHEMEREAKG